METISDNIIEDKGDPWKTNEHGTPTWAREPEAQYRGLPDGYVIPDDPPEHVARRDAWAEWLIDLAELGDLALYHFSETDGLAFLDEADYFDAAALGIADRAGGDMFVLSNLIARCEEAKAWHHVDQDCHRMAMADLLASTIPPRAMLAPYAIDDGQDFPSLEPVQLAYLGTQEDEESTASHSPADQAKKALVEVGFADRTLTDTGNAQRMAAVHGTDIRYIPAWKKDVVWTGTRFRIDNLEAVKARAKSVAIQMQELAEMGFGDPDTLPKFAKSCAQEKSIKSMINLFRSELGVPATPEMFDCDPFLLNLLNGTLDLTTGELRDHSRDDLITKLAPTPLIHDAKCSLWLEFFDRIFEGDRERISFIQRYFGYSLTGSTREHILPIFWGAGANGKSVMVNVFLSLLGTDYGLKAPADFLIASHSNRHPTELAQLFGKRLVAGVEVEDGSRFNESRIKELTGGDRIRARRCHEDFWEFEPSHKLLLATNHRPRITGTDHGIWRRIRLVPFDVTIPDDEQDKELTEKLRAELPGILNWAVEGCLAWQADGLGEPEAVAKATSDYRGEQDSVGRFIEECCVTGHGDYSIRASELFEAYAKWAETGREKVILNQTSFGLQMKERGFERYKSNGVRYRRIKLSLETEIGI